MKVNSKIIVSLFIFICILANFSTGVMANNISEDIYQKVKINKYEGISNYSLDELNENRPESLENEVNKPEYKMKMKVLEETYDLVPKTSYVYEVAKAYPNGNFTFVSGTNDYNEAKSKADSMGIFTENNQTVVAVVLTNGGKVTYSPYGVGRVQKYINGALDTTINNISYVFDNSSSIYDNSKAYTYINHGFIDDVALIDTTNDGAKIQFTSSTGWVKKANASGSCDLVVTPINQYTNPSYYYTSNGILYHYISRNIVATTESGDRLPIGPAPSFIKEGKKYLSFDGIYFYEITTNQQAYMNLINDLREGVTSGAINSNDAFYNYYNYLSFRSQTAYSADELNNFINQNTTIDSKLRGIGQYLINAEKNYGVNALLTLGVAINESGWGKSDLAKLNNNLFGLKAYDSNLGAATKYNSVESCIYDFAKNYISLGYCDCNDIRGWGPMLGNKYRGANVKYASDPYWGEKASSLSFQIDYFIAGKDTSKLKDYDNYALIMFTGTNKVVDSNGELLYNISEVKGGRAIPKGTTLALNKKGVISKFGKTVYEVNPERNITYQFIDITGDYKFDSKGYIDLSNTKVINTAKKYSSNYILEDINGDGKIDILDLSQVSAKYNLYDYYTDINEDKIIDLFDLVSIAKKI